VDLKDEFRVPTLILSLCMWNWC